MRRPECEDMTPKVVTFEIEAQVTWTAFRDPGSGQWIGSCDPLNLDAHADTWEDLISYTHEIQSHLFLSLLRDNELEAFLAQNGWSPTGPLPAIDDDDVVFDIPYHIHAVAPPALSASQAYA